MKKNYRKENVEHEFEKIAMASHKYAMNIQIIKGKKDKGNEKSCATLLTLSRLEESQGS